MSLPYDDYSVNKHPWVQLRRQQLNFFLRPGVCFFLSFLGGEDPT